MRDIVRRSSALAVADRGIVGGRFGKTARESSARFPAGPLLQNGPGGAKKKKKAPGISGHELRSLSARSRIKITELGAKRTDRLDLHGKLYLELGRLNKLIALYLAGGATARFRSRTVNLKTGAEREKTPE